MKRLFVILFLFFPLLISGQIINLDKETIYSFGLRRNITTDTAQSAPVSDTTIYFADSLYVGGSWAVITSIEREGDTLWITAEGNLYKIVGDSSLSFTDYDFIAAPDTLVTAEHGIAVGDSATKIQSIAESDDTLSLNVGGWLFILARTNTPDTTPPDTAQSATASGYGFYQIITSISGFDATTDSLRLFANDILLLATGDTAAVSDTFNIHTDNDSSLVELELLMADIAGNWTSPGNVFSCYVYKDSVAPDTINTLTVTSTSDDTLTLADSGYPTDVNGILALLKAGSAPASRTDGDTLYSGTDTTALAGDYAVTQTDTTTQYITVYLSDSLNNWNAGQSAAVIVNHHNDVPVASAVSVSGSTQIDSMLTLNYTYSDPDSDTEGTSTFKWFRNGVELDSTRQYYILSSADSSYYLTGQVTPVADSGATPGVAVSSDSVGPVTRNVAPVASSVSVSGALLVNRTLTAEYTYSDADDDAEGTTTFKWYRNGAETDSTRSEYLTSTADSGFYIKVQVTPVALTGETPGTAVMSDSVGPIENPIIAYDVTNWYVDSETGSDANSGHHPDSAKVTLASIDSLTLNPGDTVYLVAGSTWREILDVAESGTDGNYIVYMKYGSGTDPKIYGSDVAATWTASGTSNVWQCSPSLNNPMADAGYESEIFFVKDDSTSWGDFQTYNDLTELTTEYDWTFNSGTFYVYAASDPDLRYDRIEIPQRRHCVGMVDADGDEYVEFNGIEMKYGSARCFYGGYPAQDLHGLIFRNCTIGYTGYKGGTRGYGLHVFHSLLLVENCSFSDCGRRAISFNKFSNQGIHHDSIVIRNNTFKRGQHTTSLDLAMTASCTTDTITGVYFYNNIVDDSEITMTGEDETSNQFFLQQTAGYINNVYIYNNVFKSATARAILLENGDTVYIWNNTMVNHNTNITGDPYGLVSINYTYRIDYRNNITYGNLTTDNEDYGVFMQRDTSEYIQRDYNLYYQAEANKDFTGGKHGYYNMSEWAAYLAANATFDQNSPTPQNPDFKNYPINVQLTDSSAAYHAGTPIAMVTTDILGVTRDGSTPSIGAYEEYDTTNTAPYLTSVSITGNAYLDSTLTFSYTYNDGDSDAEDTTYVNWWSNGVHIGTGHTYAIQDSDSSNYIFARGTPHSATGTWASPGDSVAADSVGPIYPYVAIDTIQAFSANYSAVRDSFDISAVGFDANADTVVGVYKLGSYPTTRSDGTAFYTGDTASFNGVRFGYDAGYDTSIFISVWSGKSAYGVWGSSYNQDTVRVDSTGSSSASYSDNFNSYANASALAGQGSWVSRTGTITCNGTGIYPNSSAEIVLHYNDDVNNDQFAQITSAGNSTRHIGVVTRCNTSGDLDCYYYEHGNGNTAFGKIIDGVRTQIGIHYSVGNDAVLKLEVEGTTLRMYLNGSLDTGLSNTGSTGTYTDTDISSGNVGIYGYDASSSRVGDDWSGGDL